MKGGDKKSVLSRKEEKKIRKLQAKITYHEAHGGHRRGQVGDKNGVWSENLHYDMVVLLRDEVKAIQDNAAQRAWGDASAVKDMGGRHMPTMAQLQKKGTA